MPEYKSYVLTRWVDDGEGGNTHQVVERHPGTPSPTPTSFRAINRERQIWNDIEGTPTHAYTTQPGDGEAIFDLVGGVKSSSDATGGQEIPPDPSVMVAWVIADEVAFDDMMANDANRYFDLPTYYETVDDDDPQKAPAASYEMSLAEWEGGIKKWLIRDRTSEGYPNGYFTVAQLIEAAGPSITTEEELDEWATTHTMQQVVYQLTRRWDELTAL